MPVTVPSALLAVPGVLASSGPVSIFLTGSYSKCWVGRCGLFSGVTRLFLFVELDVFMNYSLRLVHVSFCEFGKPLHEQMDPAGEVAAVRVNQGDGHRFGPVLREDLNQFLRAQ